MIIIRYLVKETIKTQLAVVFVLFLVFFSQKFIRVLANATDGSIPASEILVLVGLYMPSMAMLMLPLSLYVGILITFGRLYAESEITVMNATGMGNRFLIRAAFYLALITGILTAFNTFWLTPWANHKELAVMESLEANSGLELLVQGQIQATPDGQAVVFVNQIDKGKGDLNKIFIAQSIARGNIKPNVVVADTGSVYETADGRQVLELDGGMRYEGIPSQLDYNVTDYQNYTIVIGQRDVRPKQRDWDAVPTMALLNESSLSAQAELQWRVTLLLCIPLMTLIVIPLSSVNPRQGRFAKLMPAILIYLAYFLAITAMKSAIEEGVVPPSIGLWGVNLVALMIGILLNSWNSVILRQLRDKVRRRHV